MKSSRIAIGLAALFATGTLALTLSHKPVLAAQAPAAPAEQHEHHDGPTNLQVLPKNMTDEQVHQIMDQWEGQLGTGCRTCHAVDPNRKRPDGRPMLNFADDSKQEKQIARTMYKMTEEINANYISKVDNSGEPVTCGTCHRGHLGPEPFVAPKEHEGPPPPPKPAAN